MSFHRRNLVFSYARFARIRLRLTLSPYQALLIEQPRQGRPAQIEAALGRAGLIASPQTVTVEHTPRTPPNSPTEYTLYQKRGDATTRYLVYDENALGHTDGLCVYSVALRYTDWNDPVVQHLTLN